MAVWGSLVQRAEMDDAMSRRLGFALQMGGRLSLTLPPPLSTSPTCPCLTQMPAESVI